jgi:hypothetical protein
VSAIECWKGRPEAHALARSREYSGVLLSVCWK